MPLAVGDFVPFFTLPSSSNPRFRIDTAAGRIVVLSFLGDGSGGPARETVEAIMRADEAFEGEHVIWFGVSGERADMDRLRPKLPGRRFLFDVDGRVRNGFGVRFGEAPFPDGASFVLDPMLRVAHVQAIAEGTGHVAAILREAAALRRKSETHAASYGAPVLVQPEVFEPAFCARLLEVYRAGAPSESGFMVEEGGRTIGRFDHSFKSRKDVLIEDEALKAEVRTRINRRLLPAVERALGFKATFLERYLVACYSDAEGGHFRAHRDNTTGGTAHRRFAVTINLNAEDYEGGDLSFPEFGPRRYRAPTGGAVVFSCSLLHQVDRVTRGLRYCFLPFLYDQAGHEIRERNKALLEDGAQADAKA